MFWFRVTCRYKFPGDIDKYAFAHCQIPSLNLNGKPKLLIQISSEHTTMTLVPEVHKDQNCTYGMMICEVELCVCKHAIVDK